MDRIRDIVHEASLAPEAAFIFQHTPIASALEEIRLFEIDPNDDSEEISGTIKTFFLNDNRIHFDPDDDPRPGYEAISYAPGDRPGTHTIKVNGKLFSVRRNLYAALKQLRDEKEPRTVWVDAMCIDERNVDERSEQVSLMCKIFERAAHVLVWLGEEENEWMRDMDSQGAIVSIAMNRSEWYRAKTGYCPAFLAIIKSPWWKRIWTVQEISAARAVFVMSGKKTVALSKLVRNLALISLISGTNTSTAAEPLYRLPDFRFLCKLHKFSRDFRTIGVKRNFLETLQLFRPSLATDPRDKVFGLLNLLGSGSNQRCWVDYDLSLPVVYARLVQHIVQRTDSLNILAFAPSEKKTAGIPSWVPDWSQPDSGHKPLRSPWKVDGSSRVYSASGNLKPCLCFSPDSTVLTTKIFFAGNVGVCPSGWRPGLPRETMREFEDTLINTYGNASSKAYGSVKNAKEAFRRTYIADVITGSRIDPQLFARFSKYFDSDGPAPQAEHSYSDYEFMKEAVSADATFDVRLFAESLEELNLAPVFNRKHHEEQIFGSTIWASDLARKPIISPYGFLGQGPMDMQKGDFVCVALGAEVPWIIRKREHGYCDYRFIGECYVHGLMDGEIQTLPIENKITKPRTIHLY